MRARNGLRSLLAALGVVATLLAAAAAPSGSGDAVDSARALAAERRFDEALALLDPVLRERPDDPRALAARAEVLRRGGKIDAARDDYERLSRLRPSESDAWFWLGTIDRWRGRDGDSLEEYGRALALSPCHGDALKGRARVVRKQGNLDAAERDLRAALECSAADSEAAELLAETLTRKGDRTGAEQVLRDAFTGADLEAHVGDLDLASNRPGRAAKHYASAVALRPDDPSLRRRLGDAERERGRTDAALRSYREAVRLDPDDGGSLSWIGILAARQGERDEAMAAFDRILARKPDDGGALTGKARLLYREGRDEEAMILLDRALLANPGNEEARILRGTVLSSNGWRSDARNDLRAVTDASPGNLDAWHVLDRVGPRRYFDLGARYSQSRVVEGLEDAGLQTDDGIVIEPARVEYLTESVDGGFGVDLDDRNRVAADLSAGREAVRNLDNGGTIYDYDVLDLTGGMDHRLSRLWTLGWRVGATAYSPREAGTIADEIHPKVRVEGERRTSVDLFRASASSDSFIWRGFAGQTDFEIFTRNRLSATWEHDLDRGFSFDVGGAVADYDDGSTVPYATGAVRWSKGPYGASLRYRHDPFPARYLTDDNRLDFITYDALSLTGRTALPWNFRLSGELLAARFGETPTVMLRDTDVPPDGVLNRVEDGPPDRNTQRLLRAVLSWSPATYEPLTLGVAYLSDHYEFDTGKYNNNNTNEWAAFVELADEPGPRLRYALRYEHSFIGDERDPSYGADAFYGRIETRPGDLRRRRGAVRLGFEGSYRRDSLSYPGTSIPESYLRARFWLVVPF